MQDIQTLNRLYGREAAIQFIEGANGMPMIAVNTSKASAKIALYGAQILAFKPHSQAHDLFYLSEKAVYQQGKAIRGGVPVCWPWFGNDPGALGRQAHGFARNLFWDVLDVQFHDDTVEIILGLESTATSKQWWPGEFRLRKKLVIAEDLTIALTTENKGDIPFSLSQALHSYFLIGDVEQIEVDGLLHVDYLDKTQAFSRFKQVEDITISEETDRVYLDAPDAAVIIDKKFNRRIKIQHQGADNFVVWNPWKRAALLSDMAAEDYQQFICVESANAIANSVIIAPGAAHQIQVNYQIQ